MNSDTSYHKHWTWNTSYSNNGKQTLNDIMVFEPWMQNSKSLRFSFRTQIEKTWKHRHWKSFGCLQLIYWLQIPEIQTWNTDPQKFQRTHILNTDLQVHKSLSLVHRPSQNSKTLYSKPRTQYLRLNPMKRVFEKVYIFLFMQH